MGEFAVQGNSTMLDRSQSQIHNWSPVGCVSKYSQENHSSNSGPITDRKPLLNTFSSSTFMKRSLTTIVSKNSVP